MVEADDTDSGRPTSRQSRASAGDLGTSRSSGQRRPTLEQFTGDSLLHFSYSANISGTVGASLTSDSQLGWLATTYRVMDGAGTYMHVIYTLLVLQTHVCTYIHIHTVHTAIVYLGVLHNHILC